MTGLTLSQFRQAIAETINRVVYGGERVVLRRHGKDQAVLVSLEDARLLERLEDVLDAREAREVLEEFRDGGQESFAWEKVKEEAGL